MTRDTDLRTYDILRLIGTHEPVGSIRLQELMEQRGYSIKGRTIRLTLTELDEDGLTRKIPGKGRKLTDEGLSELQRGHVNDRFDYVRSRIATLTTQVTYEPTEESGNVIISTAVVSQRDVEDALSALERLSETPLGPVPISVTPVDDGRYELGFPSSLTLDGVLISNGISSDLKTGGIVEYRTEMASEESPPDTPSGRLGGSVIRYIDASSGEKSTLDVVNLLIESGRTDVETAVSDGDDTGLLIVDNREAPLLRHEEICDITRATKKTLGGVVDVRRPRESGPFPHGSPGWHYASITYGGIGENALALLSQLGLVESWSTLDGLASWSEFEPATVSSTELTE